ncbi:MAG: DUF177 domain-containing protein [Muribaculaceae bacterium]|nr:DUF177 domain-containing protein [Muribaculaceae bacterium]
MASFKLNLKTLPFGSQSVNYHLGADFFLGDEPTQVSEANVDVEVTVTRTGDSDYKLAMTCRGTLAIPCDRCLDPMVHHVDTAYELSITQAGEEFDDSREHLLIVPEAWRELDLAPIVRDTVLLTIPIMHAHAPGECNESMMARLDELAAGEPDNGDDDNDNETTDPRWDALRQLKNNN